MKKVFINYLFITVAVLVGIIILLDNKGSSATTTSPAGPTNISVVEGKQVIQINAKGGYAPRNTVAKANVPTTLNIKTNGTYDCSAELSIPSLGYRSTLPPSGATSIEIPPEPAGTVIKGVCAMGMYNFAVNFN